MSVVQLGALLGAPFRSRLIHYDAFDRAIGEVIGRLVPIAVLSSRSGDEQWLPAAGELMMLSRLLIVPSVEHAVQIIGVDLCLLVLMP